MINRKVVTVGISGASCSGKTTLVRWIEKIFPNTQIIYQDDFFKPEKEIPIDSVTNLENWDCPEAIDFNQFNKIIRQLRTTGTLPSTFQSKEDKNERKDIETIKLNNLAEELSERVKNSLKKEKNDDADDADDDGDNNEYEWNILLVDGFLLYVNQDVINELDIKIFVDASYDTLKYRRENRSGYITLEGYWVDPPNYFNNIVWPNYVRANKHILDKMEKEENENIENVVVNGKNGNLDLDSIKLDDLIILESNHPSMISKNVETIVTIILDHVANRKKSLN